MFYLRRVLSFSSKESFRSHDLSNNRKRLESVTLFKVPLLLRVFSIRNGPEMNFSPLVSESGFGVRSGHTTGDQNWMFNLARYPISLLYSILLTSEERKRGLREPGQSCQPASTRATSPSGAGSLLWGKLASRPATQPAPRPQRLMAAAPRALTAWSRAPRGALLHRPGILRDERSRARLHRLFVNTTRPWAAPGARSRHRPKASVRKTGPGRTEGGVAAFSDRIISRLRHSPLPAEVKTRFLGLYEQFWEATPSPSSGSGKQAVTRLKLQWS